MAARPSSRVPGSNDARPERDPGVLTCDCGDHRAVLERARVEEKARALSALADPTRFGIIHLLAAHPALCVCHIADAFPVGQPTISHHLKVLRDAGLVHAERRGVWMYYSLDRAALKRVVGDLLELL